MFTSGAPALKIIVLALVAVMVSCNLGKAQNVKLRPLEVYEQSLKVFHTAKVRAQCIEFAAITKKKWWYFIPQLGINFGLPTINGGTSTLVTLDVQKQQNRVKLESIKSQGLLDYRTELHQLRSMYDGLKIEREALGQLLVTRKLEGNIHSVAEEANEKKEIKPVEYYQALLTYQRQYIAGEQQQIQFALKVVEVARFARYQFPSSEELPGIDSLIVEPRQTVSASRPARQQK